MFNNKNLIYQIVLLVNKIIGLIKKCLIKVITAKIANILSTNKNIKLIKKVLRQDHNFSTRLPYANKKIREIWMNMVNTEYNSTEDMINKLQDLKGKTKLKVSKNISNCCNEMKHKNFQTQQDPFAKNAQGISKIYHEVLLLMKYLQTKPQVKIMNINFHDLFYTVIKNRKEKNNEEEQKEIVDDQYENDSFNDIVRKHYIGLKINNEILR